MALFSTSFFAKCLHVDEDGPGRGHLCRIDTFLVYSWLFLVPKKNGKLHPVIDLSLLNQYIKKQPLKIETDKSVRQSILISDWAVSIERSVGCLSTHSDSSSSQEVPSFHVRKSGLPIHGPTFRNVPVCGFSPN